MEPGQEILTQFWWRYFKHVRSPFSEFDKFLTLVLGRFCILSVTVRDKFLRRRYIFLRFVQNELELTTHTNVLFEFVCLYYSCMVLILPLFPHRRNKLSLLLSEQEVLIQRFLILMKHFQQTICLVHFSINISVRNYEKDCIDYYADN